ncbi:hypothetical protein [uncultured Lacinutrix sp.]|uniref:tetratricopeptide repeat protein n=1 Tax=uncultured Lacinutrix sp. TaxID=574032 RepID=UPI002615CF1D|nr:hypothetical protein [uncultured Lacinutrix sp.]
MKTTILILSFFIFCSKSFSQVNCYIYPENSRERKACELSDEALKYKQGSKESQLLFDKAITLGPKFHWAYYEKSVPYFKRGFLIEGLKLLNEAVKLKPLDYLWYRAYWYWQYKNNELCIKDLETYYAMPKAYIQFTPGGEKDMRIILGLAYAKTGNYTKGIETILNCLNSYKTEDDFGFADYHSLGVLYVKNKQYDKAIKALKKQIIINKDLADTYYYLGIAYKEKLDLKEAKKQFKNALLKFQDTNKFININAGFKVYKSDILEAIEKLE